VRPGRAADHSPLLMPRSWKSRAITLTNLWAKTGPVTGTHYFLHLRTRSEKRIVGLLYLLVLIVSWCRKINPLRCFYDCISETETKSKQWIVSVKCFMLFWVQRTMRWLHWGVILHLTGCFLVEYTDFSRG